MSAAAIRAIARALHAQDADQQRRARELAARFRYPFEDVLLAVKRCDYLGLDAEEALRERLSLALPATIGLQ